MRDPAISLGLAYLQAELTRIDVLIRRYADQRGALVAGAPARADAGAGARCHSSTAPRLRCCGRPWARSGRLEAKAPAGRRRPLGRTAGTCGPAKPPDCGRRTQPRPHTTPASRRSGAGPCPAGSSDLLLLAVAPALDNRYGALYAYLADDALLRQPTVELALAVLYGPGLLRERWQHHFDDDAPLFRHGLLRWGSAPVPAATPLAGRTFFVDPAFVTWLLGGYEAPSHLRGAVALVQPQADSADEMLAGEAWPRLVAALHGQSFVALHGPDIEAQAAVARRLALQDRRPLLDLDVAGSVRAGTPPLDALRLVLRDALLTDALVHLAGLDAWLEEDALHRPLLAALDAHAGPLVASSRVRWQTQGVARQRPILWLEVPLPSGEHRRALWRHYLAGWTDLDALDIEGLAGQFALAGGDIRDVATLAWDRAVQRGDGVTTADLYAAARTHSSSRLGLLAQKIPPSYEWDDLVLPADQMAALREAVATVRGPAGACSTNGELAEACRQRGVTVLFAGAPAPARPWPPRCMASELGLDLYKIDLSGVVSKYIGETEKNLERIFREAESSNAILFFDEADALFGKRSEVKDAHDRYANIEISYLLQRMEEYDGVAILATNLRANLDEAFMRRLHFVIDFPFPDADRPPAHLAALFPQDVPRIRGWISPRWPALQAGRRQHPQHHRGAAYLAAADGRHGCHEPPARTRHRRELQKMGRIGALEELNADDALAVATAGNDGPAGVDDAPGYLPVSPAGAPPQEAQADGQVPAPAPALPCRTAGRSAARSAEAPALADALTRCGRGAGRLRPARRRPRHRQAAARGPLSDAGEHSAGRQGSSAGLHTAGDPGRCRRGARAHARRLIWWPAVAGFRNARHPATLVAVGAAAQGCRRARRLAAPARRGSARAGRRRPCCARA